MNLKYINEDDRCYGATGSAVALVVMDAHSILAALNIDADDPADTVEYSGEYYFAGNPSLSAKTAWNTLLNHFNLSIAATIANIMCRRQMMDGRQPEPEARQYLLELMSREGSDTCSLEPEETRRLFDKNYVYLTRVFTNYGVQSLCRDFADTLKRRRRLSRLEILDLLRPLRY